MNSVSDIPPIADTSTDDTGRSMPARLFHLAANGPLRPVSTGESPRPDRVSDLPAYYYWKDAIVVGSYVHPAGRFSLDITRNRLDGYVANFDRMKSNGVGVPILMDHTATAAATLGWIVEVKRDGDRLLELHQFLGESARDIGLRNKVSLGIDPHFVDGLGNQYGEAIVHSAVTPMPVVPDQGDYEAADRVELSLLSGTLPEPISPLPCNTTVPLEMNLALQALEQVAIMKRDLAVARGAIDPAVAAELFDLLVRPADGPSNLMMMSRTTGGTPIALAVFDALTRNRPVVLGETTGLQVLTRSVPGDDGSSGDLRQRMIALASGGNGR